MCVIDIESRRSRTHFPETDGFLLVDDHEVVRSGLAAILSVEKDFEVVGEAADGREAVKMVKRLSPDVVLMDLMMPEMNGDEATAEIAALKAPTRVLILTTYGTAEEIGRALSSGAAGALMKTVSKQELFASVRKVAAGERVIGAASRAEAVAIALKRQLLKL